MTTFPFEAPDAGSILDALACHRKGCACVRSCQRGRGLTHCPSHEDSEPSLNVTPAHNTVLVHCKGGCSQRDVLEELQRRGLWPRPAELHDEAFDLGAESRTSKPTLSLPSSAESIQEEPAITAAWNAWTHKTGLPRTFWESLGVRYLNGKNQQGLVFPFGDVDARRFRPWPPNERFHSKYIWDIKSEFRPPLWPLAVKATIKPTIFLTAGETDCGVLRYASFAAFANTKGENTPISRELWIDLAEDGIEEVCIILDRDLAGRIGAHKQAIEVTAADLRARILRLPAGMLVRGGKDLDDYWRLICQRNVSLLQRAVQQMVQESRLWKPDDIPTDIRDVIERANPMQFRAQRKTVPITQSEIITSTQLAQWEPPVLERRTYGKESRSA